MYTRQEVNMVECAVPLSLSRRKLEELKRRTNDKHET
jgi:hypothetical protein